MTRVGASSKKQGVKKLFSFINAFQSLRSQGMVVPTMVMIMIILTISALALAEFSVNHFSRLNRNYYATNTLLSAEAGAEQTLYELNKDSNFAGYPTEQEFFNNTDQGRGTYQTEVIGGNVSNEKIIIATGRIYRRASDSTPEITRKVRLTVVGTTSSGYSVQTGPGGLIMSNSATIANGKVYVNGYLSMSNSARIGSATNPVDVKVAHVNCPTGGGSSYPTQCTSGQPISLTNSAHIYGEVRATNQTNGSGMSNPGLIAGSSAEAIGLPEYDRAAHVAAVSNTISGSAASCSHNQTRSFQPNTKINGNLNISNNCKVTIKGNLWVSGELNLSNSSQIIVDDTVTQMPTVMVDGNGVFLSNNISIIANSQDVAAQFITYKSNAACSPDCADVTGNDLYTSRDDVTIDIGNSGLAAGSMFYARWSKVKLSNSGSIGAVIGQTVQLSNTGNISFGTELSSGQSVWTIKNYQQIFE